MDALRALGGLAGRGTRWLEGRRGRARVAAILGLLLVAVTGTVLANVCYKLSVSGQAALARPGWRHLLFWQVLGNLAGLLNLLAYVLLLRLIPLHIGYPAVAGLAVVGVQVIAAHAIFHEPIRPDQWLGTLLIVAGIYLVARRIE